MALAERVVLFHDHPPQGAGNAELFEAGLGFVRDAVFLPHAATRLASRDPQRVALLARRMAPALCYTLDDGDALHWRRGRLAAAAGSQRLTRSGRFAARAVGRMTRRAAPTETSPRTAPLDAAAIAAVRRSPIVDPGGVTFVYHGAADAVNLRCWIHGLPASQPFERVGDGDQWVLRVELPENSRIEYKFEVVRDGQEQWIQDPLNPLHARAIRSAPTRSRRARATSVPEWTRPIPRRARATVDEIAVAEQGASATSAHVAVYLPARFRRRPALPAARRARRPRLPALREPADGARQPDPPAGDSAE